MRLYFELIFAVSLTGTIPFCIYLIFTKIFHDKLHASFQYFLLKCILLCFLFPFSLVKNLLVNTLFPHKPGEIMDQYLHLSDKLIQTPTELYANPGGHIYKYLLPVWFLILSLFIGYQIYRYLSFRRKAILHFHPDSKHQKEFLLIKNQMNIRRHITLLYCNADVSPFTYGILKPCVVLTSAVEETALPSIIKHELQHVKSSDVVIRIFTFLAMLLHCWNPFIYLFYKEIYEISELACDEKVASSLTPEELRHYGHSIIQTASALQPHTFIPQLSRGKKNFVFRRIKHLSLHIPRQKWYMGLILYAICFIGFCIPVFAYSPPVLYLGPSYEYSELEGIDWIYTTSFSESDLSCPKDEFTFASVNEYFLLENSTVIVPSDSAFSDSAKASCTHNWQHGTRKKHRLDGKGGCTVSSYQTVFCTKCFEIKSETFISETRYAICPHQ